MKEVTLTVQPCGNGKYRLGISSKDSKEMFGQRGVKICLQLSKDMCFVTKTKCGPPNDDFKCKKCKKGYDLYNIKIHNWIVLNCFHCYAPRKPTKLKFKYYEIPKKLKYIGIVPLQKSKEYE